ncbi:MAG: PG0541 family transporter-associated protein [Planctomycetota bacterium]
MKLLLIAYNEALDDEVMSMLSDADAETYTKWTKVLGKGEGSGPHLGTHVWPKHNNVLALCISSALADTLMEEVRNLRQEFHHEGIKAFILPVEDVT